MAELADGMGNEEHEQLCRIVTALISLSRQTAAVNA